jgi:predicted ribosome quality control (RQC) complex YloA/Tae2 family protein
MPISQYEGAAACETCESFSSLLDGFYENREKAERMRQLGRDLMQTATNARDRVRRKIATQEKEYQTTQNRDALRRAGDLITANLYRMERGASVLRAEDYYEENCPMVEIRLDPLRTPQQNAANYYKRYNKAKTAEKMLTEQLEKGRAELDYLESILEELRQAESEQDLQEIRAELKDAGYLKRHSGEKKQPRRAALKPRRFRSTAGLLISVGRNNRQNDQLTCKDAAPGDIWLHTQKIHGSHVILHTGGTEADEESLVEAAKLAAYYSHAREGQNVPVDYTPVRFVKKPSGAKPGMVIYTTYRTLFVTPDEALVKELQQ